MKYHYETTGSPSPLAWLLYRLPLVLPSVCRSLFLLNRSFLGPLTLLRAHTAASPGGGAGEPFHRACPAVALFGATPRVPPRRRLQVVVFMTNYSIYTPSSTTLTLSLTVSLSLSAQWCSWPSSPLGATTLSSTTSRLCPCSSHSTTSSSSTFSRPASCPPPPALTHLPRLTPPPPPLRWRPPSI